MLRTRQSIQAILRRYIDSGAVVAELDADDRVSPFLLGEFDLYDVHAAGERFVVAACKTIPIDINTVRVQTPRLAEALGRQVVPLYPKLVAADCRLLIEERSAFLCESGDTYLPFLGLHLRTAAGAPTAPTRMFRAADQAVFLYGLYADRFSASDVMEATGLSSGSVSRALQNMANARMIDYGTGGRTGRRKEYFKPDGELYYLEGRRLFGRAVTSTLFTDADPDEAEVPVLLSGLSALGERSSLLKPSREVWATWEGHASMVPWKSTVAGRGLRHEVQLLSYDPSPFARDGIVDPFTMLATIPDDLMEADERVRIAVREAMEGCPWYRD